MKLKPYEIDVNVIDLELYIEDYIEKQIFFSYEDEDINVQFILNDNWRDSEDE